MTSVLNKDLRAKKTCAALSEVLTEVRNYEELKTGKSAEKAGQPTRCD